jgi:hypothetical protein
MEIELRMEIRCVKGEWGDSIEGGGPTGVAAM